MENTSTYQPSNSFLDDVAQESPISFDKSAIVPIAELEVDYEWVRASAQNVPTSASLSSENIPSQNMKTKSNLFLGIVLSLIGALGAAFVWGKTTMIFDQYVEQHHYAYMAILVGLLAGLGMRLGGRGYKPIYGIVAVLIAAIGCLAGNTLAAVQPIVESFQLSYYETFTTFDASHLIGFLKDRAEYVDIAFYAVAAILAYTLGFRKKKKLFA